MAESCLVMRWQIEFHLIFRFGEMNTSFAFIFSKPEFYFHASQGLGSFKMRNYYFSQLEEHFWRESQENLQLSWIHMMVMMELIKIWVIL
jgi:hypothetical protein